MGGPARSASSDIAVEHFYREDLDETKREVNAGDCNMFGFLFENNSATDAVYVQVFKKLAASVTVGTTAPDFTYKVPAGAVFGKDATDFALDFCSPGLTVACTSTRTGAGAPNADLTAHIWFWPKRF